MSDHVPNASLDIRDAVDNQRKEEPDYPADAVENVMASEVKERDQIFEEIAQQTNIHLQQPDAFIPNFPRQHHPANTLSQQNPYAASTVNLQQLVGLSEQHSYTATSCSDPQAMAAYSNGSSLPSYSTVASSFDFSHQVGYSSGPPLPSHSTRRQVPPPRKRHRTNSIISSQYDAAQDPSGSCRTKGHQAGDPQPVSTTATQQTAALKEQFRCRFCDGSKPYHGERTFTNHLRDKHGPRLRESPVSLKGAFTPTKPRMVACGYCVCDGPFDSEDALYRHIAKQHSHVTDQYGRDWTFSRVMANQLKHPKLQKHFAMWPQKKYQVKETTVVELSWERNEDTVSALNRLQFLDYDTLSEGEANKVVDHACLLSSRGSIDMVTPTSACIEAETSFADKAMDVPDSRPVDIPSEDLGEEQTAGLGWFDMTPRLGGEYFNDPNNLFMPGSGSGYAPEWNLDFS